MKSTQRSQGLVNPNQFTDLAIELWGQSWDDGCLTPAPAPQVADWLFQGLYDAGLVFVIWEGQVLTRGTWFCCTVPSSVDPTRPGKLLRFQGEQLTRIKTTLAADIRVKDLQKPSGLRQGSPSRQAWGAAEVFRGQREQLGKPVCTNTKCSNGDKGWLDGNQ